jgi:Uma2 family endonuclease
MTTAILPQVEVYRDSDPQTGYRTVHIAIPGETISPLAMPQASVAVSDLLPRNQETASLQEQDGHD